MKITILFLTAVICITVLFGLLDAYGIVKPYEW